MVNYHLFIYLFLYCLFKGCGGNGNNYPNEQICQQHCIVPVESIDSICGGGIHQRPLKDFNGVTVSCAKTECPGRYQN